MSVTVRGRSGKNVKPFVRVFETYAAAHPNARVDIYKTDYGMVRVRVIDPDFKGLKDKQREDPVWELLDGMPEDALGFLGTLTLITPQEAKKSIYNLDFENSIPPARPRRSKAG